MQFQVSKSMLQTLKKKFQGMPGVLHNPGMPTLTPEGKLQQGHNEAKQQNKNNHFPTQESIQNKSFSEDAQAKQLSINESNPRGSGTPSLQRNSKAASRKSIHHASTNGKVVDDYKMIQFRNHNDTRNHHHRIHKGTDGTNSR